MAHLDEWKGMVFMSLIVKIAILVGIASLLIYLLADKIIFSLAEELIQIEYGVKKKTDVSRKTKLISITGAGLLILSRILSVLFLGLFIYILLFQP